MPDDSFCSLKDSITGIDKSFHGARDINAFSTLFRPSIMNNVMEICFWYGRVLSPRFTFTLWSYILGIHALQCLTDA